MRSIAPGNDVLEALNSLRDSQGSGCAQLAGPVARVRIEPAPGAPVLTLQGPLFLVQGTAWLADEVRLFGLISWSDQGMPRMAAGRLLDATSAGLQVSLQTGQPEKVGQQPPRGPVVSAPRPAPSPTPRSRSARAESAEIDLSAEVAELTPAPPPAPAKSGWGAAVAASKSKSPATTQKKSRAKTTTKVGSGWGAAVAASGQATVADPADLGFDIEGIPDLEVGEILVHPRFGRCKVARKIQNKKVKVRRASGALIDLHLGVCSFSREPSVNGKRVYVLRIGRR